MGNGTEEEGVHNPPRSLRDLMTASSGYLRISPGGTNPPTGSVYFTKGQRTGSYVTVKLSGGKIRLHLGAGKAVVIFNRAGYYASL
jgi:hypothetical protein